MSVLRELKTTLFPYFKHGNRFCCGNCNCNKTCTWLLAVGGETKRGIKALQNIMISYEPSSLSNSKVM